MKTTKCKYYSIKRRNVWEKKTNVFLHNNETIQVNIYIENDAIWTNEWLRHVPTWQIAILEMCKRKRTSKKPFKIMYVYL